MTIKYDLCQWLVGEKKVHESDLTEDQIDATLEAYETLFISLGYEPVVSVNPRTQLPILEINSDTGSRQATLFLERK